MSESNLQQETPLHENHDTIPSSENTISDKTETVPKNARPIPALTRNMSEMSIEYTVPEDEKDDTELILDNIPKPNQSSLENKLKMVFELPESETLINEFPCYLIRLVTIPGWMYITTNYICFYATLPKKKKGPHKAGYLSKKNHRTSPRTYRYYFELNQNILSWYTSAETKYSPLNSIDLKCITKIESSKTRKFGIRLSTSTHHHYTLIADSEISQREWLDELRKGVFVSQHTGNSVRIVLPFSKVNTVDKPSVFQFAANIRIKFEEDSSETFSGEDYYFAFFPDIELAYNEIIETWKNASSYQKQLSIDKSNKKIPITSNGGSFLSFDSFLENISPAALPTMLMSKLINMTGATQNQNLPEQTIPEEKNELVPDDDSVANKEPSSLLHRLSVTSPKKGDSSATVSSEPAPSLTSRIKRRSLFFNWSTGNMDPTPSIKSADDLQPNSAESQDDNESQSQETITTDDTAKDLAPANKTRPTSGSYSLAKIPRAVTDAIKTQVLRADTSTTTTSSSIPTIVMSPESEDNKGLTDLPQEQQPQEDNTNKTHPRKRGSSFSSIRHHMSPAYLYNKINNTIAPAQPKALISNDTTVSDQTADVSLINHDDQKSVSETPKKGRNRARTVGSMIMNSTRNMLVPGSTDYYYQQQHINENQHRHPKGSMWLNGKVVNALNDLLKNGNTSDSDSDPENEDDIEDDLANLTMDYLSSYDAHESPELKQREQETMNEHLNANFPMLLKTESVDAVFKASFWRTIPYSGKIYITDSHFCFRSKILAGQQKLIVPWEDVIQITKLKSRSYYLMYGMTMIVKNLTEEIYLDFSTLKLRDYCYSVCRLKADGKTILDNSSAFSKDSRSMSMSSLLLDNKADHVAPPMEYDGPPLLSSNSSTSKSSIKYKAPEQPLHITCLTIGSRGDVQPYVALCKELQKDGHVCRIATHPEYENWITQHNIEFRSIGGDPGDLMKLCIDNSFLSVSFIREGTKFFYSWFESLLQSAYEACQGTDLIIESPSAMIGVHMAEKLEVPYFRSMPFPFTRTTKFPHPFAVQSAAGGRIYNDMTYVMIDMALWAGTARYVNRFRRDVLHLPSTNLDRLELWKVPHIYSFSPTVVHPPKDWPDYIHCTGYWFLDNPDMKWKPDPSLVEFLDRSVDKRPIVYIGFGSIIVPDPVETTRTIVEAVLKANVRAIICKGWSARVAASKPNSHKKSRSVSDVEQIMQAEAEQDEDSDVLLNKYPDTIYHIDSIPHDWLFPQIQGVVHHGGAGTTAAGLRAGLPTVIKPFFGDQRFWGQRIEELQVGICINKLSKNQLTEALKTITQNPALIVKAQKLGETIRKENGPRNAVECIYRELDFAKEQRINHQ